MNVVRDRLRNDAQNASRCVRLRARCVQACGTLEASFCDCVAAVESQTVFGPKDAGGKLSCSTGTVVSYLL